MRSFIESLITPAFCAKLRRDIKNLPFWADYAQLTSWRERGFLWAFNQLIIFCELIQNLCLLIFIWWAINPIFINIIDYIPLRFFWADLLILNILKIFWANTDIVMELSWGLASDTKGSIPVMEILLALLFDNCLWHFNILALMGRFVKKGEWWAFLTFLHCQII